jgi:hypothetical protein
VPLLVVAMRRLAQQYVGEREQRLGTALDRVELLDRVRAAVNVQHDFDKPLQRLDLPGPFEERRDRLRQRYDRAEQQLRDLMQGEQPLVQMLGRTLARRIAPAVIHVVADELPVAPAPGGKADREVDAFGARRAFIDLVRQIADTLLTENPPTSLGRWGIDSVLVALRRDGDVVRLTVTPRPGPRRRERAVVNLALPASRLGGLFTGQSTGGGVLPFEFPIERVTVASGA